MYIRSYYLDRLKKYRNIPLVKILAGIRRCGKSTIFLMLKEDLMQSDVDEDHIIMYTYTSEEIENCQTHKAMYEMLRGKIKDSKKYYILLDEVQEIDGWEKAVNSLLENGEIDVDIYVTGSNSKLMSSEISSYLSGRYVLIPVYPLSFSEYLQFKGLDPSMAKANILDYIKRGGFPIVVMSDLDDLSSYQISEGIYNSVITNDIVKRYKIKDYDLFNRVVRFVIENVGKTFSANSIRTYLKGENRKISPETVYNYLNALEKAFVLYRCSRYDLQGKSLLKTQEKYYLADSSLKYCMMGYSPKSLASMMENIVYFELLRRDYKVNIGKNHAKEIDFVATRADQRVYVQVCRQLPEDSDREIGNLLEIKDQYPKIIVTLNDLDVGNVNGVRIIHLADFLLDNDI